MQIVGAATNINVMAVVLNQLLFILKLAVLMEVFPGLIVIKKFHP
jgi:hypothetical protein